VALSMKTRKLILARDAHCWHCGETEDLVVHHRINRGMGGSKLLDTADNLMAVCSRYNGDMESDFRVAAQARGWGHKLPNWEKLSHPVFDAVMFRWWVLLPDGTKVESEWRDQPF
jgi:5-methylcytosine-specific restriction endonuclease McrA